MYSVLKKHILFFPSSRAISLARWHSWRRKEEWRAFQNPCSDRGTTKRLEETRTEDTPRRIHYVTHPTYPAPSGLLVVFCQSQTRKIAYIAAVPCRITRLLFSTVQCATANKRFCLSVSFGFSSFGFRRSNLQAIRQVLCKLAPTSIKDPSSLITI